MDWGGGGIVARSREETVRGMNVVCDTDGKGRAPLQCKGEQSEVHLVWVLTEQYSLTVLFSAKTLPDRA